MSNPFLGSFGPVAMFGGGLTSVGISSEAGLYSNLNQATYTITAGALGAEDTNRWLAVVAASRGPSFTVRTLTALTIGGVTYDFIDRLDGIEVPCVIGLFKKPTGLTADIVCTWDGNGDGIAMQVYRFLSEKPDPRFVAALSNSGASPRTGTLNVASGGAVIAGTSANVGADPTWVGVIETQAVEIDPGDWAATARSDDLPAETGRTITVTSTGGNPVSLVAISVQP